MARLFRSSFAAPGGYVASMPRARKPGGGAGGVAAGNLATVPGDLASGALIAAPLAFPADPE